MTNCIQPITIPNKNKGLHLVDYITVPCGKCLNCKATRISQLTQQVLCDCRTLGNKAIFVTLTYDDPHAHWLYDKNGVICRNDTGYPQSMLVKEDVQNFMKRFRKNTGLTSNEFRFVLNGEYGNEGNRAHYHILMWGIGVEYSGEIKKAWTDKNGYLIGRVDVQAPKNINACVKYILGYMTKEGNEKIYTKKYEELNLQMPFHHMSKGIGKDFYIDNIEYIKEHEGRYNKDGKLLNVPRYWKNKLGLPSPNSLSDLRATIPTKNPTINQLVEYNTMLATENYKILKVNAKKEHNYLYESEIADYEVEHSKNRELYNKCGELLYYVTKE